MSIGLFVCLFYRTTTTGWLAGPLSLLGLELPASFCHSVWPTITTSKTNSQQMDSLLFLHLVENLIVKKTKFTILSIVPTKLNETTSTTYNIQPNTNSKPKSKPNSKKKIMRSSPDHFIKICSFDHLRMEKISG